MSDPRDERRSSGKDDPSPESTDGDDRPPEPPDEDGLNRAGHPESSDSPKDDGPPSSRIDRSPPSGNPPSSGRSEREPEQDRQPVDRESPRTSIGSGGQTSSSRDDRDRVVTRNDRRKDRGPPPNRSGSTDDSSRSGLVVYVLDIISSVLIVAAVGGFLFAASGIWPPLVAIESGSMEPHVQEGDLVFVMEEERFPGAGAHGVSGIVTAHAGQETDYRMFEGYGDVIVYQPYGSTEETPIIHRAMFWVEEGENWYEKANTEFVSSADSCEEMTNCPAPNAGFITKGDANGRYDQVMDISSPVKPGWVMGTAEVRVPVLGEIRLLTGQAAEQATERRTRNQTATSP